MRERTRRIAVRRSTVERGLEASALGSSARPAGCVVGGHEGEDNVLRDDDLALFLTATPSGFGAVPMIPSLPRLWSHRGRDSSLLS